MLVGQRVLLVSGLSEETGLIQRGEHTWLLAVEGNQGMVRVSVVQYLHIDMSPQKRTTPR